MNGHIDTQSAARLNVAALDASRLRMAKARASLAFAAYDQALRNGDKATAAAARIRFLQASAVVTASTKVASCHG